MGARVEGRFSEADGWMDATDASVCRRDRAIQRVEGPSLDKTQPGQPEDETKPGTKDQEERGQSRGPGAGGEEVGEGDGQGRIADRDVDEDEESLRGRRKIRERCPEDEDEDEVRKRRSSPARHTRLFGRLLARTVQYSRCEGGRKGSCSGCRGPSPCPSVFSVSVCGSRRGRHAGGRGRKVAGSVGRERWEIGATQ
jgi:hypothetical protein